MQTAEQHTHIGQILNKSRDLPKDPKNERVVMWKVFRDEAAALEYSNHILLEPDQRIVGGRSTDSVGVLFWLGVEVDDVAAWGNTHAIQLVDPFDGTGMS
ncbi:MAG: hypothetical protein M0Z83_02175 [Betaproteobacteria bacterium]|nr:hypothetical protein [Betaproteobacteria bacterium]